MVQTKALAALIEEGLNANGLGVVTKVFSDEGKYKQALKGTQAERPKYIVNGCLKPLTGTMEPIKDLNSIYAVFTLEFVVKVEWKDQMHEVLNDYALAATGTLSNFGTLSTLLYFDVPYIGAVAATSPIGVHVPMSTTVYLQQIGNGVISNNCKIKINGEYLPITKYNFPRTRTTQSDNVYNDPEIRSAVTQQGLGLTIETPYLLNPIVKKLVRDSYIGGIGTVYRIEYDDGIVSTDDGTFTPPVWYMIVKSCVPSYLAGRVPNISITFLPARLDVYAAEIAALESSEV